MNMRAHGRGDSIPLAGMTMVELATADGVA